MNSAINSVSFVSPYNITCKMCRKKHQKCGGPISEVTKACNYCFAHGLACEMSLRSKSRNVKKVTVSLPELSAASKQKAAKRNKTQPTLKCPRDTTNKANELRDRILLNTGEIRLEGEKILGNLIITPTTQATTVMLHNTVIEGSVIYKSSYDRDIPHLVVCDRVSKVAGSVQNCLLVVA